MTVPLASHAASGGHSHVVQFYDEPHALHDSVTTFMSHGLRAADPAVIIATPENWGGFRSRFLADGHQVDAALDSGKLVVLDARETLDSFMRGGMPDAALFEQVAGTILARSSSQTSRSIRLYGEMVDLLCRAGQVEAGLELERLWGQLGRRKRFSLFCGYQMNSFARVDEQVFARICAEHSQVLFPTDEWSAHARLKEISDKERRLKEAEGFRLLVESVEDYAIYMLDPHGTVTSWNAGAERIKGYLAREILGSHFSCFYPQAEIAAGKCELELQVAARDGRFEDEGYRLRKDGTRFWANVIITALRDKNGGLVGYAKVTRDLTERRKAEQERLLLAQAREANRVKDEFLATISHELRTPLSAIVGWASLLGPRIEDPYVAKGIETIRRNAQAQARIIEDVLDMARIASGKLGIETRPLDLVPIVRAGVESMRLAAEAKRISLVLTLRTPTLHLLGDPTRLQQVLWNLLSNAMKFTPPGGAIEVELDGTSEHAQLSVKDTGSGIEPAFLPHVFERFSQGDGSTARRAGGLGLGLSIVHHLVELHGGQIKATSAGKDRGAEFSVQLPLMMRSLDSKRPLVEPARDATDSKGNAALRLDGIRVLVVEDEPDARELVGALLESRGARVELTASAAEAYSSLSHVLPDVIVSDIGMPDEDGYQFVQRLRQEPSERGGSTPIVALTAYASAQDRQRALAAGYTHHLAKPVDTEELIRVLGRLARQPLGNA